MLVFTLEDEVMVVVDALMIISFLSAADCSHRLKANVALNVTLFSHPNIIENVLFAEEKRSGVPKSRHALCFPARYRVAKEG